MDAFKNLAERLLLGQERFTPRAAHDQRTQSTYLFGAATPESLAEKRTLSSTDRRIVCGGTWRVSCPT